MRDSMIFYRSFYEAIKELSFESQGIIYNAIYEYGLNKNEVELKGIEKTIFTLIKPQLDANLRKFNNGNKGGRPPKNNLNETELKPKNNLNETKTKANVNDNVNVNVKEINNIDSRKTSFANTLKPFLEIFGKDVLNNFYFYWTEHGEKDKKMRFEKETSFCVKRRLERWVKNDYSKNKQNYLDSNVYIPNEILN